MSFAISQAYKSPVRSIYTQGLHSIQDPVNSSQLLGKELIVQADHKEGQNIKGIEPLIQSQRQGFHKLNQVNENLVDESDVNMNPRVIYLRKLYAALFVQLLLITSLAVWIEYDYSIRDYFLDNPIFIWVSLGGIIFIAIFGLCARNKIRQSPWNTFSMILWTVCFGIVLVYSVSIAGESTIGGIMMLSLLSSIVLGQLIHSLTVSFELTYSSSSLFIIAAVVINFQAFSFLSNLPFLGMVVRTLIAFIFAFYLVFDTQSHITGANYDFIKEEWQSGTVLVYLDVLLIILRTGDLSRTMIVKRRD